MPVYPTFMTKLIEKQEKKLLNQYIYERIRNSLNKIGLRISLSIVFEEKLFDAEIPSSDLEDCKVGLLTSTDMPEVAAMDGYSYSSEELVNRLDNKSICVGLKHRNKIVSFTWCDIENRRHHILPFELSENDAYLYDAYTTGAYRGKNLIMLVRYHAYKELNKIGRLKFLSASDFFNTPAIKFKKKLDANPLQLVFYICLFNKFEKNFVLKNYGMSI